MKPVVPLLLVSLFAISAFGADLTAVKAEPDPNRRSERALENASQALEEARKAASADDAKALAAAFHEMSESADVCQDSLAHSGKDPRRSKYYKQAEQKLHNLIRQLAGFADTLPLDQRDEADAARQHLQQVHDAILEAALGKK